MFSDGHKMGSTKSKMLKGGVDHLIEWPIYPVSRKGVITERIFIRFGVHFPNPLTQIHFALISLTLCL